MLDNIKGHSIFIEDGDEFFNVIEANLVAKTEKLHVMLKGDQKPASFWMASPSNFWRDNVAAGSVNDGRLCCLIERRYGVLIGRVGFWFELPEHPHGPSFTLDICPGHGHMLEFRNNTGRIQRRNCMHAHLN
jgi:hypothetical protein